MNHRPTGPQKETTLRLRCLGLAIVFCLPSLGSSFAGDSSEIWPGWRGPTRDGKISGDSWPEQLKGKAQLVKSWRVALGKSYSGPIVSETAIFVTESVDKKEVVRALDRKSGSELWKAEWKGSMRVPFFAASNGSWIRSTPGFDGERLYVAGMRDVLVCLDARDGKEIWKVDFAKRFKTDLPSFGFVCSPLVTDRHVYVQAGAAFIKLDKLDGKTVWRSLADEGGMYGSAFSSPILSEIQGKSQLLVQTRKKIAGVDPENGNELWSAEIPAFRGMNILTPTIDQEKVFTSTYGGGTRTLSIDSDDGKLVAKEAWKDTAQGYMSTPVIIDGHAYLHLRNQRMTCFQLETGKRTWTSSERFGKYMSFVCQGDKILALDQRGELLLLRANPAKLELLDRQEISDSPTWAHLAVAGEHLVVRELNALTVWRWGSASEADNDVEKPTAAEDPQAKPTKVSTTNS